MFLHLRIVSLRGGPHPAPSNLIQTAPPRQSYDACKLCHEIVVKQRRLQKSNEDIAHLAQDSQFTAALREGQSRKRTNKGKD